MKNWRADSDERADTGHRDKFNAPLFRSLVEQIKTGKRTIVLDLGAARTQTIALFSQDSCRLDIADISDGLDSLNALPERGALHASAEALLPRRNSEPTDVVFCWDILNYLERPALRALMSCIGTRARQGTLVHALIIYSQTQMPAHPGSYVPQDDFSLLNAAPYAHARPAPRYSVEDLGQCLPDFSIVRAVLLSNGMQEFLFQYRGQVADTHAGWY